MFRRILLVMSVAALMGAMLAVMAVPAFATVHPLSKSELSNAPSGTAAATQDPPGLSGQSSTDNIAEPVVQIIAHQPQSEDVNPFDPSTFPENGPFKPETPRG